MGRKFVKLKRLLERMVLIKMKVSSKIASMTRKCRRTQKHQLLRKLFRKNLLNSYKLFSQSYLKMKVGLYNRTQRKS